MVEYFIKHKSQLTIGLASFCIFFTGCVMDYTDQLSIQNESQNKLQVLLNKNYPDTSFSNATLNSYIEPKNSGGVILVNRKWEEYLVQDKRVSIFIVEWKPSEKYYYPNGTLKGEHRVLGKMIVSQEKIDSLGGKITFPKDFDI